MVDARKTPPRQSNQRPPPRPGPQGQPAATGKPPTVAAQVRSLITQTMPAHLAKLIGNRDELDRFVRVFLTAIESGDPDLIHCTHGSLARAMLHAAEVGLEPGGAYPYAYLIPYKNRDRDVLECQLQISVWGYVELVRRGGVRKVWADVVYSNDYVETVSGTEGKQIIHKPNWFATRKERGHVLGAYACALLDNGETVFEPVSWEELMAAKAANKGRTPAWEIWPEQQYQKVALKRLQKYLPKGKRPERLLEIDEDPGTQPLLDVQGEDVTDDPEQPQGGDSPQAMGPLDRAVAANQQGSTETGVIDRDALFSALCDADERWQSLRERVDKWSEPEALAVRNFLRIVIEGIGESDVPPRQPDCMRLPTMEEVFGGPGAEVIR